MAVLTNEVFGHTETIDKIFQAIQKDRFSHANFFVGPEGIGKQKAALAISQGLLCTQPKSDSRACGQCSSCLRVSKEQHESLLLLESEKGQIKVDQVRRIQDFFSYRSLGGRRVVVINDAHLLNQQAGNALLKSLEEPPEGAFLFLISHVPSAVLQTLRSRCQFHRFSPLSEEDLLKAYREPVSEAWAISAAQGSVTRLGLLVQEDIQEVRTKVADGLVFAISGEPRRGIDLLSNSFKEKELSLQVLELFLQMFRDAQFLRVQSDRVIHRDLVSSLQQISNAGADLLSDWSDRVLQMERDLFGNMERTLLLETFFYAINRDMQALQ